MIQPRHRQQPDWLVPQRKSHSRKIPELGESLFARISADADVPDNDRGISSRSWSASESPAAATVKEYR